MRLRVKRIDMETDGAYMVALNEFRAISEGIHAGDRVKLTKGKQSLVAITNLSDISVKSHEIGVFNEVSNAMGIKEDDVVRLSIMPRPQSMDFIKKKLDRKEINEFEMFSIIDDVVHNRLSNIELSAFVTACYTNGLTSDETYFLTKAVVETGDILALDKKPILDKHCLGGIPGNRTTMVVVPIIAAAGYMIPKTSSRSITSPAGTADTMEVLADVNINVERMRQILMRTNGCIAFGGAVNLAAADDKLIRVRHPLHLDPEPLMLASIMAKKVAVGSTHVLIDIPVGPEAKTKSKSAAIHLGNMFKALGRRFKQKVKVVITDGTQPIGNGIGPVLEAADVLKLLKQTNDRPRDLEEKAVFLASEMMAMVGRENTRSLCEHILRSGQAYRKMREIIREQGGNPNVTPSDLKISKIRHEIKAERSGRVSYISNKAISGMALACGAPLDKGAGLYLYKHVGDSVKKGDHLITLFAKSPDRVRNALNIIKTSEAMSY